MPKLWTETIETHRSQVRDAVLDATAALVGAQGLRAVTMSRIAEDSGIGRATLYKYFPDVESILLAWHDRQVSGHLAQLVVLRDRAGTPFEALRAVLGAYATICHRVTSEGHPPEVVGLLHRREHLSGPEAQLRQFLVGMIADAVESGAVRTDVSPDELADYCLNALAAAGGLKSKAAVERLVSVTLAGVERR